MAQFLNGEVLASFAALTFLEIVLGIDNIVFLAVAVHRLPADRQPLGRQIGLWLAMGLRIGMLVGLVWVAHLDVALFSLLGRAFTIKDVVLIAGGLFLLAKGTTEIHGAIEDDAAEAGAVGRTASFIAVMTQIGFDQHHLFPR